MISKERLEEQFWSKVNTTGKNDCWYLKKSRGNNQYGNVSWEGKSYRGIAFLDNSKWRDTRRNGYMPYLRSSRLR